MGKRGPKSYEQLGYGVVPMRIIAAQLGISERNAYSIYQRALRKLRAAPEAFPALLECVHAVAAADRELLQAGSAECDREFVAKYGAGLREEQK